MPSSKHTLNNTWQPLLDLSAFPILYFGLEIINYDGQAAEFAFGNPENGATPEIFVPGAASHTKDNRALRGFLYGKVTAGTSNIQINIW